MEKNRVFQLYILGLYVCFTTVLLARCDATKLTHPYMTRKYLTNLNKKPSTQSKLVEKVDMYMPLDAPNPEPYMTPPFPMAPYDSLPPISFPHDPRDPLYCVYPPSTTIPSPTGYAPPPPPAYHGPTLPGPSPFPPLNPNPPTITPNPPTPAQPMLSPPYYEPTPPPPRINPSPRFLPPVVYPPPAVPPPPRRVSPVAMWCVAKASVPDPIILEAMNYACGSGAYCDQIQPSGPCFEPNTVFAHASYAYNSYWQRTKARGGTCDFGGTALLVTVDPSYDGCHFVYS